MIQSGTEAPKYDAFLIKSAQENSGPGRKLVKKPGFLVKRGIRALSPERRPPAQLGVNPLPKRAGSETGAPPWLLTPEASAWMRFGEPGTLNQKLPAKLR